MQNTFLFVPADTILHRLHPVVKLLGLTMLFVPALAFNHPLWVLGVLVLSVGLLLAAAGISNLRRLWAFFALLFVMSTLLWMLFLQGLEEPHLLFTVGPLVISRVSVVAIAALVTTWLLSGHFVHRIRAAGDEPEKKTSLIGSLVAGIITLLFYNLLPAGGLFSLAPVNVSSESLMYGLAMGMRITSLMLLGLTFVTTTRPEDFAYALRKLGLPIPASLALTLSFRLLPHFLTTVQTVKDAQRARGLELDRGSVVTRLRRYLSLAAPVFGYALRQADSLSRALEARGLWAGEKHTEMRSHESGMPDMVAMVAVAALAAACIYLRLHGYGELLPRL